jgi:tetratricopeptide (TPR) repeat protein
LSIALVLAFIAPAVAADKPADKGQKSPSVAPESKDPNYWFQKGALCATYGNNQAAIRYFGKAITLDPNHSGAYFSKGISYGQLGDYSLAVADINRAIEMAPQNVLFLQSGQNLSAGRREGQGPAGFPQSRRTGGRGRPSLSQRGKVNPGGLEGSAGGVQEKINRMPVCLVPEPCALCYGNVTACVSRLS